jgi:hypothetical protein
MPIRFSTEAANADHMRIDADPVVPQGQPKREPKGAASRQEQDKNSAGKPGKDINAAGFIKDKDAGEP